MPLIDRKTLTPFDYFLIIGVIASSVIYSILEKDIDVIGTIAAISGIICVVLSAKGNILNYVFGFVNVTIYAYISYKSHLYGDAALNALYYIPMQFIGWFSWKNKSQQEDSTKVQGRKMTTRQRIMWSLISLVSVIAVGFILKLLKDPMPFKDSATTMLSILAMLLMVQAYMEQWVLWILVNAISVAIWIMFTIRGDAHAELMIIMWVFYLANSINGFFVWKKLSANNQIGL